MLDFFSSIIFTSGTTHPICLFCRIRIQICIKGIHGFKLIPYASGMDQSEHHHRLAFVAADWCPRLHGWPIMPPLLGVYVFTDRLAFVATDWCPRLHGWPIRSPLLGVYIFTDRLPRMTPTGAFVFMAGHDAATANRRHHLQHKLSTSAADWFLHFHMHESASVDWPYRLHRRSSHLLLTSALASTAGLYCYYY